MSVRTGKRETRFCPEVATWFIERSENWAGLRVTASPSDSKLVNATASGFCYNNFGEGGGENLRLKISTTQHASLEQNFQHFLVDYDTRTASILPLN